MRMLAFILALFSIGTHAAAAGSGKTAEQAPKAAKVIAFYGDSTIRGYRTHSGEQVAKSTPQAFAEALGNEGRYIVRNEGVDSSRVEHLLAGTDGRHPAWRQYLPRSGVDIVIINHASKNGSPVAQYKSDMRRAVALARAHNKQVILMTPSPIGEGGLDAYVEAMRELAAEDAVPLIDVFRYLAKHMADTGLTIGDLVPDVYHPADEVYMLIGQYAAREFRKITGASAMHAQHGRER